VDNRGRRGLGGQLPFPRLYGPLYLIPGVSVTSLPQAMSSEKPSSVARLQNSMDHYATLANTNVVRLSK